MDDITKFEPIPASSNCIPFICSLSKTTSTITTSPSSTICNNNIPTPTYLPPDRNKKSHARKQPTGHVPRPRNAFILFRCDFVRQEKLPATVEKDHRNISRIAGRVWKALSEEQKAPWVEMAKREKENHYAMNPGYKYHPTSGKKKRGDGEMETGPLDINWPVEVPRRRSSSCPPGVHHIPQAFLDCSGYGAPKTRDDLERRPSRVTLYQSTATDSSKEFNTSMQASHRKDMDPISTIGYPMVSPGDMLSWDYVPPPMYWNYEMLEEVKLDRYDPAYIDQTFHAGNHGVPTFTNPFPFLPELPRPVDPSRIVDLPSVGVNLITGATSRLSISSKR